MALSPGTKLGVYEIVAPIGKGGMSEVYRARDTKLGRDVAIKLPPEELSRDSDRLARFELEAKLLAALSHASIATLYGFEESDGIQYLAVELVPGATLAERIASGPIPVEEAIVIARQVSDTLEAAHEAGVIHRDLKPDNIKVSDDGHVKVLDFGLAKAFAEDGTQVDSSLSPTLTRAGTQTGVVLGTAAYVSPEQARGKGVDKRADIFAFGCVVDEMLTARRAVDGETVSDILASVIKTEPDWTDVPTRVRALVKRCVEKGIRQRYRDIGDVRLDLDVSPAVVETAPARRSSRWPIAGAGDDAKRRAGACPPAFPPGRPTFSFSFPDRRLSPLTASGFSSVQARCDRSSSSRDGCRRLNE